MRLKIEPRSLCLLQARSACFMRECKLHIVCSYMYLLTQEAPLRTYDYFTMSFHSAARYRLRYADLPRTRTVPSFVKKISFGLPGEK